MSLPPVTQSSVGSDRHLHDVLSMEDLGRPVVPEYIDVLPETATRRHHDLSQSTLAVDYGSASSRLVDAEQDVNAVVASALRHLYMVGFIPTQEHYVQALNIVKGTKRRARKITTAPVDLPEHPVRMDL